MLNVSNVPLETLVQSYTNLPPAIPLRFNLPDPRFSLSTVPLGKFIHKLPVQNVLQAFNRSVSGNQHLDALARETEKDNWDDEHGIAITAVQWVDAKGVLAHVAAVVPRAGEAIVSASGDGYIHLTWVRDNGDRAVLEIGKNRHWWSIIPADPSISCELSTELNRSKDALKLLAQFVSD